MSFIELKEGWSRAIKRENCFSTLKRNQISHDLSTIFRHLIFFSHNKRLSLKNDTGIIDFIFTKPILAVL